MKQVATWLLFAFCVAISQQKANAAAPFANCRQCLVVITDSWSSSTGEMFLFERNAKSSWRQRGPAIPVLIGKSGLAWGRGLANTKSLAGPIKKEGDDKAPAGIFRMRTAFGYAPASELGPIKLPYLAVSERIVAVDDPRSRYYNQFVDASKIRKPDWRTAEKMFGVDVYEWGVVVEHNMPPKPGAGSCIFLHVWENAVAATSGCTAMSAKNLVKVMRRLDPARHPLLVQLPRSYYKILRRKWNLPGNL